MNPPIIIALTEDRRRSCACGAAAGPSRGLCRKCQGRMAWRRRNARPRRRYARRRSGRQARDRARNLSFLTSRFRLAGAEAGL